VGAIVAEPSFPNIWYAARAAFTVEVTVKGRPAHVGLHYTGTNALLAAHSVLDDLFAMADKVAEHCTELRIEPEPARHSIMLIGGTAGGGTNFNIVPGEFRFTIDRLRNPDGPSAGWEVEEPVGQLHEGSADGEIKRGFQAFVDRGPVQDGARGRWELDPSDIAAGDGSGLGCELGAGRVEVLASTRDLDQVWIGIGERLVDNGQRGARVPKSRRLVGSKPDLDHGLPKRQDAKRE
jgi:hypothetical protein